MHNWIQTNQGHEFWPINPEPSSIDIVDIAHVLSRKPRFGGNLDTWFSVGQHSIVVCALVPVLESLMHDCEETYSDDVPTPFKTIPVYTNLKEFQHELKNRIWDRFLLRPIEGKLQRAIKWADSLSMMKEKKLFFNKQLHYEDPPLSKEEVDRYDDTLWLNAAKLTMDETKELFLKIYREMQGRRIRKYENSVF